MTNHTELLNYLSAKHNLKRYLEIGVQDPKNNFDKVICEYKIGCDPEVDGIPHIWSDTSDIFFDSWSKRPGHYENTFDLIFIDGLHHADQVKKDFENSLRCLNDGGFIVLHDTLPENEAGTIVPRETKQWWGNVYKFVLTYLGEYPNIEFRTVNIDNGCTVIWKVPGNKNGKWRNEGIITYKFYEDNKKYLMQIIQPSEIETFI